MGFLCNDKEMANEIATFIHDFEKKLWTDFTLTCDSKPFAIEFFIRQDNKDIAHFKLIEMPNCCGILVSTQTWVIKEFSGQGLAQEMMLLKEALAKKYGYTLLFATVDIKKSLAEVHILEKFGWTLNSSFVNKRTKNTIGLYTKDLSKS